MRVVLRNSSSRVAAALAALAVIAGCSANKNHEARRREADAQRARAVDAGVTSGKDCVHRCDVDPGSAPVMCDIQEQGLEFFAPAVWNFTALAKPYFYDDGSTGNKGLELGSVAGTPNDPQLPVVQRCADRAADRVYRVWGGPYVAWGGGIGTSILDFNNRNSRPPGSCSNGGQSVNCASEEQWLQARTLDVSAWDGISFWARRGPESQSGIRVALGDKYTDDDLNVDASPPSSDVPEDQRAALRLGSDDGIDVEQKYCKRTRMCSCEGNRPCTLNKTDDGNDDNDKHYCYDPRYEDPTTDEDYLCGPDACNAQYATQQFDDPAFDGRPCTPHVFASGKAASYCFDPGKDAKPAENYEICGDHWTKGVYLTGDWQLFLVPFNDLRQQGYGKEAARLLTDQISIVRFTWAAGFIDYYLADVRFYRVAR